MALDPNKALLRLRFHISSMEYLENGVLCFIEVIEDNNISFDRKMVEDEDGKEDGKEAVTVLEEEASKKMAQDKTKKYAVRVLLFAAIPRLSAPASAFIPVLELSAAILRLSAAMSRSSVAMPELSATIPESPATELGSSVAVPESVIAILGFSAPMSMSVPVPELSILVLPSASALVLPGSSLLPFPALLL